MKKRVKAAAVCPEWPRGPATLKLTPEERERLSDMLARLGITDWDVLLVGDASGSTGDRPSAWACVSVERETRERLLWYGFANRATINYAESVAYDLPLTWFAGMEESRLKKPGAKRRFLRVHVVTDSTYAASSGAKTAGQQGSNTAVWDRYETLRRQGILVHWHHQKRETTGLNQLADQVSKLVRKLSKAYNVLDELCPGKTLHDVNPDD